ncbi:MAG: hypothetical protein HY559_00400 [Gammaproteobacteria bacterium]|nr:hypothetical protein [Gammaproteobacteria bacterium]
MHSQPFNLRISLYGAVFAILVYGGAMGVILFLEWPFWLRMFGMLGIGGQGAWQAWKAWGPHRVTWLKKQDLGWILETAQKKICPVALEQNSFVAPLLLILKFKRTDVRKRCSVVILPDSLPESDRRRLRVISKRQ